MKNLFIIVLLLSVNTGFAQIQNGTIVVGGGLSLGGNSVKNDGYYNTDFKTKRGSFSLDGNFEKFLNDQTAFGLGIIYSFEKDNQTAGSDEYESKRHSINLGPKLSHYIPIINKLYLTLESYAFIGIGSRKETDSSDDSRSWGAGFSFSPGIILFLNDKWALDAGFGSIYYNYQSEKAKEINSSGEKPKIVNQNYGLNFSANSFNVGLRYYLNTVSSN